MSAADFPVEGVIDTKGNVVFTYVVDNLPLTAYEVYDTSLKYLQNEYRTSKYTGIEEYIDKGIVYGKGSLNSFFTENGLVKSEVFSADYHLRLDAKDNKARVQVIFGNYKVLRLSDASAKEEEEVRMSSVAPFADANKSKRYKKAYKALQEYVATVFNSVGQSLRSATSAPVADDW